MQERLTVHDAEFIAFDVPRSNAITPVPRSTSVPSPTDIWSVPIGVTLISILGICDSRLQIWNHKKRDLRDRSRHHEPEGILQSRLFEKRQHILRVIQNGVFALREGLIRVRHLMTTDVTMVSETTTALELRSIMTKMEMRHRIVCNVLGDFACVISDRDLIGANGKLARDVMTREGLTVDVDSHVSPATTMRIERHIFMLPVVDPGKLCGLSTATDLVMDLQSRLQMMVKLAGSGTRANDRPFA